MEKKLTKKQVEEIKKEQAKKYGSEFISYLEDGESAAIFIVRDIVKSINTHGKWIDVLKTEGKKNKWDRWDFSKIEVEIFPRKTNPEYKIYPENATEREKIQIDMYNHYLTWKTANEDIDKWRAEGYVGQKFEVCPKLVNKNRGKFKEIVLKEIWSPYLNLWMPLERRTPSCDENSIREVGTKKVPLKPKWEYYILSIKRL